MALSRTNRGSQDGAGSSRSLSAFTPANGTLLVAVYSGLLEGTGNPHTNSSVSGGGLTWTRRVAIQNVDPVYAWSPWLSIWTAPVTTGSSTTVSGTNSGTHHASFLCCFEYSGQDASPIGASGSAQLTNVSGAQSLTLSGAPASSSEVVGAAAVDNWTDTAANIIIPGTGWTEVYERQRGTGEFSADAQVRTGSTSTTVGWDAIDADPVDSGGDAASSAAVIGALEIKADAGGGGSVSGTFGVTVDAVTQSASADLLVQGSLSQTIAAVTQSASADLLIQGTLASTVAAVTQSASADLLVQGTLASTIAAVTQAAEGDLLIQAAAAQDIDAVTLIATGSAQEQRIGTLEVTLDNIEQSASADLLIQGQLNQTVGAVTQSASGDIDIAGSLAVEIDPVTLAADGEVAQPAINATFNVTIDNVVLLSDNRTVSDDGDGAGGGQPAKRRRKQPRYVSPEEFFKDGPEKHKFGHLLQEEEPEAPQPEPEPEKPAVAAKLPKIPLFQVPEKAKKPVLRASTSLSSETAEFRQLLAELARIEREIEEEDEEILLMVA